MITLLVGTISNCILDPIFIFKFHWGLMGAAVATVIGQILSAVLSLIYLFKLKSVKLCRASFVPDKSVIGKIIPLGASSFLAQISVVFSMAAVLNMCKKYAHSIRFSDRTSTPKYRRLSSALFLNFFR